jgi:arylsulfatase A-like enzyme
VIALDIHPTARAAAGLDMPVRPIDPPLDGVNLLPHLDGASDKPPHEALFWRLGDQQAVRKGNFKLVRDRTADEWLTDLAADEGESQNLASNRPDVLTELGEALAQWERQLSQPLWPRR